MRTRYVSTKGILEALISGAKKGRKEVSLAIGRGGRFLTNYASSGTKPGIDLVNDVATACGYEMLFRSESEEISVTPNNLGDGTEMIGGDDA